ncbi:hypothetical protein K488DRAFT_88780 [Vararia minispora EC-137]|uniref:Uncharacterized protein n=1 Tax=Vararia minispora EC-137 TaxID=1314806 RepID=A0ACB8QCP7_9AGAM|nr:hypothetical protein K488DRAFT_88780 [Vararia minispora EC-137]
MHIAQLSIASGAYSLTLLCLCLSGGVTAVQGNNSAVPSAWKSSSPLNRSERLQLAQSAHDVLTPLIDPKLGTAPNLHFLDSASMFWGYTLQDMLSEQPSLYQDLVTENLDTFGRVNPGFYGPARTDGGDSCRLDGKVNSDAIIWGVVAYYAFHTYGNASSLQTAKNIWDEVSPFMVTPEQAANGSHPSRNVPIQSTCNGLSVAGAVFWNTTRPSSNTVTNAETIGPFLALSAYLFNTTGNATYSMAANLSATFIQQQLYNDEIILDSLDLASCAQASVATSYSFDSGLVIEGLSAWANVSSNATLSNITESLVTSSIQYKGWTGTDGVNTEEPNQGTQGDYTNAYKALLIRGIHTALLRLQLQEETLTLIKAYITVQFNALITNSSSPGSNTYSSSWIGPPAASLEPVSQIAALQVLVPAFAITPSNAAAAPMPSRSHAGAIVGGVIGSLLGAAVVLGSLFLLGSRSRRARRRVLEKGAEQAIEPFNSPTFMQRDAPSVPQKGLYPSLVVPSPLANEYTGTSSAVSDMTPALAVDVAELLRSEVAERLLEQRVVGILARTQQLSSGGASWNVPPSTRSGDGSPFPGSGLLVQYQVVLLWILVVDLYIDLIDWGYDVALLGKRTLDSLGFQAVLLIVVIMDLVVGTFCERWPYWPMKLGVQYA